MPDFAGASLSSIPGLAEAAQRIQMNQQAINQNRPLTAEQQTQLQQWQPTQVEVAPGTPAQPASLSEAYTGQQATDQEGNPIEGPGPGTVTATPAQPEKPSVNAEGYTQKGLMEQMGPQNFAKLMETKAGRQALQDKGVLTAEEMDKRVRVGRSRVESKTMMDRADEMAQAGDAAGSMMMRARAWERIADASDDPNKMAWAHTMANNLQKQAMDARDDERANTDAATFFGALTKYRHDPNQENLDDLLRASGEMHSKSGRGYRDRLIQNMTTESLKGLGDLQVQTLYAEAGKKVAAALKDSHTLTFGDAMNQTMRERPELIGPLVDSYLTGKRGQLPSEVEEAIFGQAHMFKKDEYQVAKAWTKGEDGLDINDPDPNKRKLAWQKYTGHLKDIMSMTRRGSDPGDIQDRHDTIRLENAVKWAQGEADKIQTGLDKDTMYQMYAGRKGSELPDVYKKKLELMQAYKNQAEAAQRMLAKRIPGMPELQLPAAPAKPITISADKAPTARKRLQELKAQGVPMQQAIDTVNKEFGGGGAAAPEPAFAGPSAIKKSRQELGLPAQ
jgi:hypothetical protein